MLQGEKIILRTEQQWETYQVITCSVNVWEESQQIFGMTEKTVLFTNTTPSLTSDMQSNKTL